MDNLTISSSIKKLCKQQNLSIKTLLEDCNINRNFIYDLEHKESMPSIDRLARIADYLGCSIDYLLGREQKKEAPAETQELSEDEKELVLHYRVAPADVRESVSVLLAAAVQATALKRGLERQNLSAQEIFDSEVAELLHLPEEGKGAASAL